MYVAQSAAVSPLERPQGGSFEEDAGAIANCDAAGVRSTVCVVAAGQGRMGRTACEEVGCNDEGADKKNKKNKKIKN